MARGTLRIYLGAAPGVGKTYAMLGEGLRRRERGADVVVGVVETHGRRHTAAQLGDLEVVPRRAVEHRGTTVSEMDLDAVLARRPDLVLVDELAHTNAPGGRHEKRWQDVDTMLAAGIDVITTLNVQHLESLNDVVERITGVTQRETVPDAVVRAADQIELVDMSPEALRRRLAHGNVYPAERIDAALTNYFRPGNLGALRELALLWVADRVEESLAAYVADHGIDGVWPTRERVVVGLSGAPSGDDVIRRAARIAGRAGGELIGVHVGSDDGLHDRDPVALDRQRRLVTELGGVVREVVGDDPARAVVEFARAERATQIVLGASRHTAWQERLRGSFVARITRLAGDIDVHVIAHRDVDAANAGDVIPDRPTVTVSLRRRATAWIAGPVLLAALTPVGVAVRDVIGLSTVLLVLLAVVLAVAAIGGRLVGIVTAVAAMLVANWFFVPPFGTLSIDDPENLVSLVVFVAVAATVGTLVDLAARRATSSQLARAEASLLAHAAAVVAADPEPLPALLEQIRSTFGFTTVELIAANPEGDTVLAAADATGTGSGATEETSTSTWIPIGQGGRRLQVSGRRPDSADLRVLRALVDQLEVAVDAQERRDERERLDRVGAADAVRTGLLRSVSHDLRTPLASIKAMVTGLLDPAVRWTPEQRTEALTVVDEETDRLDRVVGNLLDASRLQIGAVGVQVSDVPIRDVVINSLRAVDVARETVTVDVEGEPIGRADPALLERALANVISNAIRHGGGEAPRIMAAAVGDQVTVCVIDRGPGVDPALRSALGQPFGRLGDATAASEGVGLGLSIAIGFVEAMGGTIAFDETPGGGLTVSVTLPRSSDAMNPYEPVPVDVAAPLIISPDGHGSHERSPS
jgi:two-component system, OmpR family, sensor histidine kinase KdpD